MLRISKLSALFVILYLCFIVYSAFVLFRYRRSPADAVDADGNDGVKLRLALAELNDLRAQNDLLKRKIANLSNRRQKSLDADPKNIDSIYPPSRLTCPKLAHLSPDFERVRRSLHNNVREYWYSVKGALKDLGKAPDSGNASALNATISRLAEQYYSLVGDSERLSSVDDADGYRRRRLHALGQTLQRRLDALQNPRDCRVARKLLCDLNKGCGFGCQIHHVVYCFIVAYSLNRTLVLNSDGWSYSSRGWEGVFAPLSTTCDYGRLTNLNDVQMWQGEDKLTDVNIIKLPIVDSMVPRSSRLPLAIPREWAAELLMLHGNPSVWWLGQFLSRLWRLAPEMRQRVDQAARQFRLGRRFAPKGGLTVGVHVRRTDKVGFEASFHHLDEYMEHVEEWYNIQDVQNIKRYGKNATSPPRRRVFLATDDAGVVDEARRRYGGRGVDILADKAVADSARLNSRYSDSSLVGVMVDVHLLSLCQLVVCTFSSQVCRLAYELMQAQPMDGEPDERPGGDMADRYRSLDDIFYFGGQNAHDQVAILDHEPRRASELQLRVGDAVGVAGNHWDGYSKGVNRRTGISGLYPSYKVAEKWPLRDFPVWPDPL